MKRAKDWQLEKNLGHSYRAKSAFLGQVQTEMIKRIFKRKRKRKSASSRDIEEEIFLNRDFQRN